MRRTGRITAIALWTLTLLVPLNAQPDRVDEHDVKAAFLYNFAKYVTWPAPALGDGNFRICIVGEGTFVKSLDSIIAGETIEGHPVSREMATPATAKTCHVIFLEDLEVERTESLLALLKGTPVLTVGDIPEFLESGGMIALVREGNRIRFDVDPEAARQAGLAISSRLLRVARRVLTTEAARQ